MWGRSPDLPELYYERRRRLQAMNELADRRRRMTTDADDRHFDNMGYTGRPFSARENMNTSRKTCLGSVRPQLYSESLKTICRQNDWDLQRLKTEMEITPRPKSADSEDFYSTNGRWEKRGAMFTSAEAIRSLGEERIYNSDDEESVLSIKAPNSFCYLCSTMEEHLQNHGQKTKPRKPTKPKIVYIAPPPRVRRKKEERPPLSCTEALYKVDVFTGDQLNASTNANVHITIEGSEDSLPRTKLHKNMGCSSFSFGRAARETFYLKGPNLGNLERLTIEHDGLEKKHGWFLDRIEVKDMATKETWIFLCDKWLSLHVKDYKIKRELKATPKQRTNFDYKITVHTGKKAFAGTDASIFITLFGSESNSPKILLKDPSQKCFERGRTDTFEVTIGDLGEMKKIRIEHDGKGMAPGWFLDKVMVYNKAHPSKKYYFYCGSWLSKDEGDGRLWKELPARNKPRPGDRDANGNKLKYEIRVLTGDVKYAGTDANVFIQLIGAKSVTSEIGLDDEKNNFEKAMLDVFTVEAEDVGPLEKILIGHDNSGIGSGWFLEKVTIRKFLSPKDVRECVRRTSLYQKPGQRRVSNVKRKKDLHDLEHSDTLGLLERKILYELKAEEEMIRRQQWAEPHVNPRRRNSDGDSTGSEYTEDESDDGKKRVRHQKEWVRQRRRSSHSTYKDKQNSSEDEEEKDNRVQDVRSRRPSDRERRKSKGGSSLRDGSSDDDGKRGKLRSRSGSPRDRQRPGSRREKRDSSQEKRDSSQEKRGSSQEKQSKSKKTPVCEEYVFQCHRWFSVDDDDKQIVRELVCDHKSTHYKD